MGFVVGVVLCFIALAVIVSLIEKGSSSKVIRPYIGAMLIAALIAGMGLVLGLIFHGVEEYFLIAAKVVAVFTGVVLCLQLVGVVSKKFFVAD
jgi:hypothetical protein